MGSELLHEERNVIIRFISANIVLLPENMLQTNNYYRRIFVYEGEEEGSKEVELLPDVNFLHFFYGSAQGVNRNAQSTIYLNCYKL